MADPFKEYHRDYAQLRRFLPLILMVGLFIIVFSVLYFGSHAPTLPSLEIEVAESSINLSDCITDFKVNAIVSAIKVNASFVDTITIDHSIPVKEVENIKVVDNSTTFTLLFDNMLVKNFLWSKVYHLDATIGNPQVVTITLYGWWEGTELCGSTELTVYVA